MQQPRTKQHRRKRGERAADARSLLSRGIKDRARKKVKNLGQRDRGRCDQRGVVFSPKKIKNQLLSKKFNKNKAKETVWDLAPTNMTV